jgi:hypothetical protein
MDDDVQRQQTGKQPMENGSVSLSKPRRISLMGQKRKLSPMKGLFGLILLLVVIFLCLSRKDSPTRNELIEINRQQAIEIRHLMAMKDCDE